VGDKNEFCSLDQDNNAKWSVFNALTWKLEPKWPLLHLGGGQAVLMGYKQAWIVYNRARILSAAATNRIPADFLGCVILNEVGGDPPWIKHNMVLPYRQHLSWTGMTKAPLQTSEGAIKIQLQAALSALGRGDESLTHVQQDELTACLETDSFNIDVVARFLQKMIRFDYPTIDTRTLTDEQFVIAGSRYNRGTTRPLSDLVQSLKDPQGTPSRKYTEYGRAMLRHRPEVRALLGM
jgi:hypothetical protein